MANVCEQNLENLCLKCNSKSTQDDIKENIDDFIRNDKRKLNVIDENAQKFISWAQSHKQLKVVSADIPAGILPQGLSGTLHDVKVNPKRGPDDAIYDASKEIRNKVARGNCILELHRGEESGIQCIVYALKKFTGGLGDDDDRDMGDNHTWKRYFTKPLSDAKQVVCTRKANGEAAHLSAVRISGQIYLCGGSKNVHMLIRDRGDIEKYEEGRFRIAKEVCSAIMDVIEALVDEDKNRLLNFLCTTHLTGVFEILSPDHQHVEDLSHLAKAELRFIAWTSCDLEPQLDKQLCSMPPHTAIEICRALGLPTVEYEVIDIAGVDDRMKDIRRGYNYEGEVLYFIDHTQNVIGLLKKKTIWYIICRAIREKVRAAGNMYIKNPHTFSTEQAKKKIKQRLKDIQTWLGLDDESRDAWTDLGVNFLDWCTQNLDNGSITFTAIADLFPVTWKRFLTETNATDKIDSKWEEPQGSDE